MSAFEKWSVWITTLVVATTGIVLGVMKYLATPEEPWAVVNHPLQPLMLKLHIVSAPTLVFAVGVIALRHVWKHYRTRMPWGRRSGITGALTFVAMVLTGYLIQVLTAPGWLLAMVIGHVGTGLAFLAGLTVHQAMINRGLPPKLCDLMGRGAAKRQAAALAARSGSRPPRDVKEPV